MRVLARADDNGIELAGVVEHPSEIAEAASLRAFGIGGVEVLLVDVAEDDDILGRDAAEITAAAASGRDHGDIELLAKVAPAHDGRSGKGAGRCRQCGCVKFAASDAMHELPPNLRELAAYFATGSNSTQSVLTCFPVASAQRSSPVPRAPNSCDCRCRPRSSCQENVTRVESCAGVRYTRWASTRANALPPVLRKRTCASVATLGSSSAAPQHILCDQKSAGSSPRRLIDQSATSGCQALPASSE